ncbi:unnamed protein product [Lymnaea stagnalis]|uniref:EGF domain-specific O-linked N-acetylglucosamine transferase n=1 Tax=Lymnaea stagnalis TaxID=6523 RepID=A0AAV2HE40_LYMST
MNSYDDKLFLLRQVDMSGRELWYMAPRRFRSKKIIILTILVVNCMLFGFIVHWKTTGATTQVPQELLGRVRDQPDRPSVDHDTHVKEAQSIHGPEMTRLGIQSLKDDSQKTVCNYRTTAYLSDKSIVLDQAPFVEYTKQMLCLEGGNIAAFSEQFVMFNYVIVDAEKTTTKRKGGENMEEVWDQREEDEYFKLLPGYFQIPCLEKPSLRFGDLDHLRLWNDALRCYPSDQTDISLLNRVTGVTLAIQRYEYVNLYHTMTDFYNAFVLMLLFGVPPSKMTVMFVDAHPVGTLDPVWAALFGRYIRAGRLPAPTVFPTLIWGMLGYSSPLNRHELPEVPYLNEFREFFLTKHNVTASHTLNCRRPNVVLIWRRDYVAHPRNKDGSVVRKFANEDEMVEAVKKTLGDNANVLGLQLDALSMKEQLEVVAKCDILIGMHGAGLSHILFLAQTSGVIELKPNYSNPSLQHFQAFARWRKLPYSIWINSDPANEKDSHKTYIPSQDLSLEVKSMYSKICENKKII